MAFRGCISCLLHRHKLQHIYLAFAKNFMADYFKMSVGKIFPRSLGSYLDGSSCETCYVIPTMKKGIVKKLDWVPTMDGQPRLRLMNGFKSNVIVLVSTYIARSILLSYFNSYSKSDRYFFFSSPINVDVSSGHSDLDHI